MDTFLWPCLGFILSIVASIPVGSAEQPVLQDLFASGKDDYHTYRIPAIVTTNKGTLLVFCEGRKNNRNDHGNLDMLLRRSVDGGDSWMATQLVYEEGGDTDVTIGNACPVVDRETGIIWLPFTRNNTDVLITSSKNDGKSWSKPINITKQVKRDGWGWYATGPGNGIQLTRGTHKGRLIIPCDHRLTRITDRNKSTRSHVIYSDDHGSTWTIGGSTDFLMNECTIAERTDGSLLLNMRSNRGRKMRAVATSQNGGIDWSKCVDNPALPEPVCQANMLRVNWPTDNQPGRLVFSNPASPSKRENLVVRVSYNDGKTWPTNRTVYQGAAAYSCMTVLANGNIGIVFERDNYAFISYCEVSLQWLEDF